MKNEFQDFLNIIWSFDGEQDFACDINILMGFFYEDFLVRGIFKPLHEDDICGRILNHFCEGYLPPIGMVGKLWRCQPHFVCPCFRERIGVLPLVVKIGIGEKGSRMFDDAYSISPLLEEGDEGVQEGGFSPVTGPNNG